MPFCDIQDTPQKGPLFGVMVFTVPGLHCERAKGDAPTIRDRRRPNLTLSSFFAATQLAVGIVIICSFMMIFMSCFVLFCIVCVC